MFFKSCCVIATHSKEALSPRETFQFGEHFAASNAPQVSPVFKMEPCLKLQTTCRSLSTSAPASTSVELYYQTFINSIIIVQTVVPVFLQTPIWCSEASFWRGTKCWMFTFYCWVCRMKASRLSLRKRGNGWSIGADSRGADRLARSLLSFCSRRWWEEMHLKSRATRLAKEYSRPVYITLSLEFIQLGDAEPLEQEITFCCAG